MRHRKLYRKWGHDKSDAKISRWHGFCVHQRLRLITFLATLHHFSRRGLEVMKETTMSRWILIHLGVGVKDVKDLKTFSIWAVVKTHCPRLFPKIGYRFWEALSLSMVLQKEARKRNGRKRKGKGKGNRQGKGKGKGKENDWEEEKKRKGKERKRIGKSPERGKEKDWEEERKRIGKRKGKARKRRRRGKEIKRKGKGLDLEKKRKGRGTGEKTEGVKAEEGKKRKGKRTGSICGLVRAYFLNKWVSLRYRYRGIANLASCMYVTLCKTTSDVDIVHHYI